MTRLQRFVLTVATALVAGLAAAAVASADVSFVSSFGSSGTGAGQLAFARAVATDTSGNVFVADTINSRIDEFDASGGFVKAFGWGVSDGASHLETCTSSCQDGLSGPGDGQLGSSAGIAVDGSGDVYVSDNLQNRIEEFSAAGAFIRTFGWGVSDGANNFETCTTSCQAGAAGTGAGQFDGSSGIATDSAGNVFVTEFNNDRIDEFSAAGAFVKAYGWGVLDGANSFETCTATCQAGLGGGGPGELSVPFGAAVDAAGNVFVADTANNRIDEFDAAGNFTLAFGWGVGSTGDQFAVCHSDCRAGSTGTGDGQFGSSSIRSVATASSGAIYGDDMANSRIERFTGGATPAYTLTAALAGSGSGTVTGAGISCPAACSQSFAPGTAVALTPTPAPGSTFAGWSGACSGTGPCNLTMSADMAVTATFTASPGGGPKPAPACKLVAASSKVALHKRAKGRLHKFAVGALALTATCDQAAKVALKGVLTQAIAKKRVKHITLRLTASLPAGVTKVLALKLPRSARRALGHHARESVTLTLTATNANGTSRATRKIARLKAA